MLGAPIERIASTQLLRRERIFGIASRMRERFDPKNIDAVASEHDIVLIRSAGASGRDAGFAYIEFVRRPELIESLVHPDRPIVVWGGWHREPVYSIVINTNSGIPEAEVFWHEWYHLFHSPYGIQRSENFEHRYSTEAVLHNQEERRADEFAAAVLIPSIKGCASVFDITEKFGVSERLATHAVRLYKTVADGLSN